jgi:peptidoglycan/xylan/chitin deacetylase (PgdA/CDA1 family)
VSCVLEVRDENGRHFDDNSVLLIVNYHYIRDGRFLYPGIHPLPPQLLRQQIEDLSRVFEFVGERELLAAIAGEIGLPESACLLTFDDGLQEQFTRAVPILEQLGVPAIFFVPGLPYAEGRPLTVHKIHWLRSHMEPATFLDCVTAACQDLGLRDRLEAAQEQVPSRYFWDDPETRKAKYLLNVMTNDHERALLVDSVQRRVDLDGADYFENLYMTTGQLKELNQRFAIGTHGHSHSALAPMSRSQIEEDIKRSLSTLSRLDCTVKTISYPYGYEGAVSLAVFEVARCCGLQAGFTTERSFNLTLADPMALARVDTNDAPGGKSPIFMPTENGFQLKGAMTMGRTRYCRE